ncbi:FadR/GntR family transcriptional regulator [Sphingomonas sp. KR3-1]|uniref:FadR/GntR family transcriptional regulator n=1 Tax=Sphingomonas sp. KR3-1 TaxID=3156611 RepID=UPI0032B3F8DF
MNMGLPLTASEHPELGRNLTYGLLELLGRGIVTGQYDQDFPTEGELARQFGVSRSVTREAVKMLCAKGLVDGRPKTGTYVLPDKSWNLFDTDVLRWHVDRAPPLRLLLEFNELRRAIEPEAAELAAMRAVPEEIAPIGAALERMRAADLGQEDPIAAEVAFHLALLDASRNPFFRQFRAILAAVLPASVRFVHRVSQRPTDIVGHAVVYEAIAAYEPDAARKAMRQLLGHTIRTLEQLPGAA